MITPISSARDQHDRAPRCSCGRLVGPGWSDKNCDSLLARRALTVDALTLDQAERPLSTVEASILRAEWQILLRARRSRFWGRATQVTRAPIAMTAAPNDPNAARAAPVAAKGVCDCWDWPIGGGQGKVISSVSTVCAVSPTAKLTTSRSAHASSS